MQLTKDISGVMPTIAKAVFAPAFNADVPVLSFRHNNWRVIINKRDIFVKDIAKEADAVEVMEYLKNVVNTRENDVSGEVEA